MKRAMAIAALCITMVVGGALAQKVKDTRDLEQIQQQIHQAVQEMERARAANHYDMKGHGVKAEEHLRQAESEVSLAIQAAKSAK